MDLLSDDEEAPPTQQQPIPQPVMPVQQPAPVQAPLMSSYRPPVQAQPAIPLQTYQTAPVVAQQVPPPQLQPQPQPQPISLPSSVPPISLFAAQTASIPQKPTTLPASITASPTTLVPASAEAIAKQEEARKKAHLAKVSSAAESSDNVCVFPEAVIEYFLRKSGCEVGDKRVLKLVGLDVQNLVLNVLDDVKKSSDLKVAYQQQFKRKKQKTSEEKTSTEKAECLQRSSVETALRLRGLPASMAPFYPGSDD